MIKQAKKKKWKAILGGMLTLIAGGYGVNVAIGPNESNVNVEIKHEMILNYGTEYKMEDGRTVEIWLDNAIFRPS